MSTLSRGAIGSYLGVQIVAGEDLVGRQVVLFCEGKVVAICSLDNLAETAVKLWPISKIAVSKEIWDQLRVSEDCQGEAVPPTSPVPAGDLT